ncbi:MAG: pilus assembly protein TadG-related protein, partial [Planctomycetia bacterium]
MSCAGTFRQGRVGIASRRRGAILVLTALLLVFLVTMVAFTIDIGYMLAVRSEAKRATDAAALAGVGAL